MEAGCWVQHNLPTLLYDLGILPIAVKASEEESLFGFATRVVDSKELVFMSDK